MKYGNQALICIVLTSLFLGNLLLISDNCSDRQRTGSSRRAPLFSGTACGCTYARSMTQWIREGQPWQLRDQISRALRLWARPVRARPFSSWLKQLIRICLQGLFANAIPLSRMCHNNCADMISAKYCEELSIEELKYWKYEPRMYDSEGLHSSSLHGSLLFLSLFRIKLLQLYWYRFP